MCIQLASNILYHLGLPRDIRLLLAGYYCVSMCSHKVTMISARFGGWTVHDALPQLLTVSLCGLESIRGILL